MGMDAGDHNARACRQLSAAGMQPAVTFAKPGRGRGIYAWRRETMERSFAEAKELHDLRYARVLGIRSMYERPFLTAAVQNMKVFCASFFFFLS